MWEDYFLVHGGKVGFRKGRATPVVTQWASGGQKMLKKKKALVCLTAKLRLGLGWMFDVTEVKIFL